MDDRGDTGDFYIVWSVLFDRPDLKGVKDAGKVAMVHVDLISGLSPKEVSVEYLERTYQKQMALYQQSHH